MNQSENLKTLQRRKIANNNVQNSSPLSLYSSAIEKYSPFIKEVKTRIIRTLSLFVLTTIFGFVFYENIIKFLIEVLGLKGINIVFTSPFQFINLAISF